MHKAIQTCFLKETAILSKHFLSQHNSLFSLVIAFGFKTKKYVWGNVGDSGDMFILLEAFHQLFNAEAPFCSFFLSVSPLTLSKLQGQWLCPAQLLERRFKQSHRSVPLYIVLELPFDSFKRSTKDPAMFSAVLESPRLILYTMAFNAYASQFSSFFFFILSWETICFQISHDDILRWSAVATLNLSNGEISAAHFCSCSRNMIFIIPACISRRIAEYELKAYLFYKMLLPPWGKCLPRLFVIYQGKIKSFGGNTVYLKEEVTCY